MKRSRSCTFAATVTTVGIVLSPATGLAIADPSEPVIPIPQPSLTEVPIPELPDIQDVPPVPDAGPTPQGPQEQPPEPPFIEQAPPTVIVQQPDVPQVSIPDDSDIPDVSVEESQESLPQIISPEPSVAIPPEVPEISIDSEITESPADEHPQEQVIVPSPEETVGLPEMVPSDTIPSPIGKPVDPSPGEMPDIIQSDLPDGQTSPVGVPQESGNTELAEEEPTSSLVAEPPAPSEQEVQALLRLQEVAPTEAAVHDIHDVRDDRQRRGDHDWKKGDADRNGKEWPRWPVPGRDRVDHDRDYDEDERKGPPRDHGVKWHKDRDGRPVIINYTKEIVYVNVTNINVINNVNSAVKVVPVYPDRPVYLGRDWCNGASGSFAWSANFGVSSHGASARFAASGAFTTGQGCGVHLPPPVHELPRVAINVGHNVRPVYARAVYYEEGDCLVVNNNTFLYGKWQGKPYHSAFDAHSYRTDVVFEQPIKGVPRWLFDTGNNPTQDVQAVSAPSEDLTEEWAPLLFICGGLLLTAGAGATYWNYRRSEGGNGA